MAVGQLILFIVTSHGLLGDSGEPTGWYLPEIAHPYNVLSKDYKIVMASPKGGYCPMDNGSLAQCKAEGDKECVEFLNNIAAMTALNNSISLDQINPDDYAAVFFPGGHGPMFDLVNNKDAHRIARSIYESGRVVAAVCHGTIGIANLKLTNGKYLVAGKRVTGFANSEEDAIDRTKYMPVMLEDVLKANGGLYSQGKDWSEYVLVDGKIITGQNPASAGLVGREILKAIGKY